MQQGTVGGPVFIPCKLRLCCPHPECNCAPPNPITKKARCTSGCCWSRSSLSCIVIKNVKSRHRRILVAERGTITTVSKQQEPSNNTRKTRSGDVRRRDQQLSQTSTRRVWKTAARRKRGEAVKIPDSERHQCSK
jgi:hypothetical protein